ncbi:MAG: hypothetical protein AABZ53_11140 [Planctomycetota bacterium]
MFDRTDELLIIADGDLPSLVALAAARVAAKGWPSQGVDGLPPAAPAAVGIAATHPDQIRAITEQARVFAMLTVDLAPPVFAADWLAETSLLLAACAAAAAAGRPTVVWPVQYESGDQISLDRVSKAVDRSIAATRLVQIDSGVHACPDLRIDTPLVDYTDRQIADLAVDLSVPVHLCWWWDSRSGGGDAHRLRQRWMTALAAAGFRTPDRAL